MGRYRYYLALQTLLPDTYKNDRAFIANLEVLQSHGFDGVELNVRDPSAVDPVDLKHFLSDFNLSLSMFATGFTAKTEELSLASLDETKRKHSMKRPCEFLQFTKEFEAGIIAGFLKASAGDNTPKNREALKASIAEIAAEALKLKTYFLVEAINRFESPLGGNSLDDTWNLLQGSSNPYTVILPDTWHMNIEESNIEATVLRHKDHFVNFHLSDNNRFFSGHGALDFKKILGILDANGYTGKLAIEGNLKQRFSKDVETAMDFLRPLIKKR